MTIFILTAALASFATIALVQGRIISALGGQVSDLQRLLGDCSIQLAKCMLREEPDEAWRDRACHRCDAVSAEEVFEEVGAGYICSACARSGFEGFTEEVDQAIEEPYEEVYEEHEDKSTVDMVSLTGGQGEWVALFDKRFRGCSPAIHIRSAGYVRGGDADSIRIVIMAMDAPKDCETRAIVSIVADGSFCWYGGEERFKGCSPAFGLEFEHYICSLFGIPISPRGMGAS